MRLRSIANSPRALLLIALALLPVSFVVAAFHAATRFPSIPGYRTIPLAYLPDDFDAKALDGKPVWVTSGVVFHGAIVRQINGDRTAGGVIIYLKLGPGSMVRLPEKGARFSPYGVLHLEHRDDGSDGWLNLDVIGALDDRLVSEPSSALANTLYLTALGVLLWSGVIGLRQALQRRRAYRFEPGCCAECGYDLRATPGRCPECGWVEVKSYGVVDRRP